MWSKFLFVSVFLFLSVSVSWVSATNGNEVPLEVVNAEEALLSAYNVVLDAKASGANVSSLLNDLSIGAEYLAEAYVYVRLGDSERITHFVGLCHNVAEDVQGDATALIDGSNGLELSEFFGVMFTSVVSVIVVVALCFVVWRAFKRNYLKNVRGEVV